MKKDYRFRKVPRSVSIEYGMSMALEKLRDRGLDPTIIINNSLRQTMEESYPEIYREIYGEPKPEEEKPISNPTHRPPRKAGLRK